MGTAVAAPVRLSVRRGDEAVVEDLDRLREFAVVSGYRTLKEAAEVLGTHHTALITRVERLRREIGHPLFIRATTTSPMKLPPIGEAVVAAIHAATEQG
jgi:DNA-binding transcriptional LysR family regulator